MHGSVQFSESNCAKRRAGNPDDTGEQDGISGCRADGPNNIIAGITDNDGPIVQHRDALQPDIGICHGRYRI